MCTTSRIGLNAQAVTNIGYSSGFYRNVGAYWANMGKLPVDFNAQGHATSWNGTATFPCSDTNWGVNDVATSHSYASGLPSEYAVGYS